MRMTTPPVRTPPRPACRPAAARLARAWPLLAHTTLLVTLLVAAAPAQTPPAVDWLVAGFENDAVLRYDATGAYIEDFFPMGAAGADGIHDMALGPDGNLYVPSAFTASVLRFAPDGSFIDVFVAPGDGLLVNPSDLVFGPDGHLYVASFDNGGVMKYDRDTGAFLGWFVTPFSIPSFFCESLAFGLDGDLYCSAGTVLKSVLRFDGQSGALVGPFIGPGLGGLDVPHGLSFGPDGHLYVASFNTDEVLKYHAVTGAFLGAFVSAGSGGVSKPHSVIWAPDGKAYVGSNGSDEVLRYDGKTGAFLDTFVTAGAGGLDRPQIVVFRPPREMFFRGPIPGVAGALNTWTVEGATPGNAILFVFGFDPLVKKIQSCPGVVLGTLPFAIIALTADANGVASLPAVLPPTASGVLLRAQALDLTDCRGSTPTKFLFP